jgi:hypothetical protein
MKKINVLLLMMLPLLGFSQKIRVFVLAGQSNMNGFGFTKDLPADLNPLKTFTFSRVKQLQTMKPTVA